MSSIAMAADSTQSELKEELRNRKKKKKDYEERRKRKTSRKAKISRKKHVETDEETSDHDSDLDLSRTLYPIGGYIKNRDEMIEHMFKSISIKKLKAMLPDILRSLSRDELKALCVEELEYMSKKRIGRIIDGADPETISSSGTDDESSVEAVENDEEEETIPADVETQITNKNEESWMPEQCHASEELTQVGNEKQEKSFTNDEGREAVVSDEKEEIQEVDEEEEEHIKDDSNPSDDDGSGWTGSLASSPLSATTGSPKALTSYDDSRKKVQKQETQSYEWSSEEEGEIRSEDETEVRSPGVEEKDQNLFKLEKTKVHDINDSIKHDDLVDKESTGEDVSKNSQRSCKDDVPNERGQVLEKEERGQDIDSRKGSVIVHGNVDSSDTNWRSFSPEVPVGHDYDEEPPEKETYQSVVIMSVPTKCESVEADSIETVKGSEITHADSTSQKDVSSPTSAPQSTEDQLCDQPEKISCDVLSNDSNGEPSSSAGCDDLSGNVIIETEELDLVCHKQDHEITSVQDILTLKTKQGVMKGSLPKPENNSDSLHEPGTETLSPDNAVEVAVQHAGEQADIVSGSGNNKQLDEDCMISAEIGSDIDDDYNDDDNEEENSSDCEESSPAESSDVDESWSSDDGISISVQGVCITVGQEGNLETLQLGEVNQTRSTEASKSENMSSDLPVEKSQPAPLEEGTQEQSKCSEKLRKKEKTEKEDSFPKSQPSALPKKGPIKVKRPAKLITKPISAKSNKTNVCHIKVPKKDPEENVSKSSMIKTTQHVEKLKSVEKRTTLIRISQDRRIIKAEVGKALSTKQAFFSESSGEAAIESGETGNDSSNLGDLKISIGSIGDRRVIQMAPEAKSECDVSLSQQVSNKRIIVESTSLSKPPKKLMLKRKTEQKASVDSVKTDTKTTVNQGPTPPKKIALHSVQASQNAPKKEVKAQPTPEQGKIKKTRTIKIKSTPKEQQSVLKNSQPQLSLEHIDQELGDLVKKGASSDVNVSITQSQMEILELEMRARAIKAMLKAQDKCPEDEESTKDKKNIGSAGTSQTTQTTVCKPCAVSVKPAVKPPPPPRSASVKSTISIQPAGTPKGNQKQAHEEKSPDLQGHSRQYENNPGTMAKRVKPKSVVSSVASVTTLNLPSKSERPSMIQRKLSQMAGYPAEAKP